MENGVIKPVPTNERTMNVPSTFFLWLGSNVVVTTVFTGMLFVPDMSYLTALTVILSGTLIGTIFLILMGNIGARTGLPTMVLSRGAFGQRGAILPTIVNMIILIGWSWIQAYMAALSLNQAVFYLTGYSNINLFTILTEAIVVLITLYGHSVIEKTEKVIVTLMIVFIVVVFGYMFITFDVGNLIKMAAMKNPTMTITAAFDVVIATAFSWMLMVSDHNRYCKSEKAGMIGTYFGFSASMIIAMVLGATVAGFSVMSNMERTYDPTILIGQTSPLFGFIAAMVIFTSVLSTNVMVLYSIAMSYSAVFAKQSFKLSVIILGIICIAGALLKDWLLTNFQSFLLMIGSLFIPVVAIMLVDYYILKQKRYDVSDIISGNKKLYQYRNGINYVAYISFILGAGFAYYFTYVQTIPTGTTLLTFFVTCLVYFGLMKLAGQATVQDKTETSEAV